MSPVEQIDCIVLLEQEHAELDALFASFELGNLDAVPQICAAIEAHLQLDHVLFPTVMREVDGSAPGAAPHEEDSRELRNLMAELDGFTAVDTDYLDRAKDLVALAREHLLDDESEFIVKIRSLRGERRAELGEVIRVFRLHGDAGEQGTSSDGDH